MSERHEVTVQDRPDQSRYEGSIDSGVVAGFAEYEDRDDVRVFLHTEVDDAFEGRGVGSALAQGALDDVRRQGLRLIAKCPFIKAYIDKQPEYADLQV